jgi:hypothetical protein
MDTIRITLKDILMGYLGRRSFGYPRMSLDILVGYLFWICRKKIAWIHGSTGRSEYPMVSSRCRRCLLEDELTGLASPP